MKLIVGLGNPGKQYMKTRHNVGFMILDEIAKKFKFEKKFNAEISKENNVIFAKPSTFMNESGQAVAKIVEYYKIPLKNVYIVHDDKDIAFGTIRIRQSGSSAGHNGIKSIIECLHSQNFARFRIGIKNNLTEKKNTADFVLSNFTKTEQKNIKNIIIATNEAIETAICKNIEFAMNCFNAQNAADK